MRQTDVQFHPYPNDCGYQPCWRQLISNISIIPGRFPGWTITNIQSFEFKHPIKVMKEIVVVEHGLNLQHRFEGCNSSMILGRTAYLLAACHLGMFIYIFREGAVQRISGPGCPAHSRCPSFFFLGHLWVQLLRHPLYTIWWQPMQRCTGVPMGKLGHSKKRSFCVERTIEAHFCSRGLPRTSHTGVTVNWVNRPSSGNGQLIAIYCEYGQIAQNQLCKQQNEYWCVGPFPPSKKTHDLIDLKQKIGADQPNICNHI